jgi:periplasmic copper chaperone A
MELSRRQVVMSALLAAGVPGWPAPAWAQDYWINLIRVSKPWAPPSRPGARTASVYMVIENRSGELERLMHVQTPVAERATFVDEEPARGIIESVNYIELRARREILLRPGRLHIKLEGLKQPLVKGTSFPLTLILGNRSSAEIRVEVDDRP